MALIGDYTSRVFEGSGVPISDLDSVHLFAMPNLLNGKTNASGDPDGFFADTSVLPFKYIERESLAQYA